MATYKEYKKGEYKDSNELTNAKQQNSYWGSQQLQDFTYDDFTNSDRTVGYQNEYDNLKAPGDFSFSKQQGWDNIINQILNREKFSYDVNGDALYQQYKDQYVNQGKMAMMDTMGQAAAMTGGYGNSYAQSVGQQAYQGYLQQLTDKIPELYSLALDKYNSEGEELYNQYGLYSDQYKNEYGQHRDSVSDYQFNKSNLADMIAQSHGMDVDYYTTNRDTAYKENESHNSNITDNRNYWSGIESDLATREWNQYTDNESIAAKAIEMYNDNIYKNVQEQQAKDELAEKQRQFDENLKYEATGSAKLSNGTTVEKAEEFTPYQYAYKNDDGQTVFTYNGKEVKVETGKNPYTRTTNPNTKYGTFDNGYQPNNVGKTKINGKEVVNKLSKSGITDVVNGVTQNVWKDLNGKLWIWDGTQNAYLKYEG